MYKDKKIIAIIPARGGSKGIPHKNIRSLAGIPLLAHSINVAKSTNYIDRILVSTDDPAIRNVALYYGADAPFLRPAELSDDHARSIDCILHALNFLREQGDEYDYVMLLQPTQPIRKAEWLQEAIEALLDSGSSSLVSVCPVSEHPILMRTIADGHLVSLLGGSGTVRRQDFPEVYRVNGTIYLNRVKDLNADTSLNDNEMPYPMKAIDSIDIDTEEDFRLAEEYLSHQS